MKFSNTFKKIFILGILFVLPIVIYLFLASGVNNFAKLPILTQGVSDIQNFKDEAGKKYSLQNKITVLMFLGNKPLNQRASIYNLAHKIYKKNYLFNDFQFVLLSADGTQDNTKQIITELKQIENTKGWKFLYGSTQEMEHVFNSLQTNLSLDYDYSTPYVFIIDKDKNLRGRDQDEDAKVLYGYDGSDYSLINNKMSDDVKVLLAEYRLALKKYKSNREI